MVKALGVLPGEPNRHHRPLAPVDRCRLRFDRQRLRADSLAGYVRGEAGDCCARLGPAHKTRDFALPAKLRCQQLASDSDSGFRLHTAADQRLRPAQRRLIRPRMPVRENHATVEIDLR